MTGSTVADVRRTRVTIGFVLTSEWASRCGTTSCVQVRQDADGTAQVRDSTLVDTAGTNTSPVLAFAAEPWQAFVRWAPGLDPTG